MAQWHNGQSKPAHHIIEDERLLSKWNVKLFFSRRLKQFDDLTRLTLTPIFYDRSAPPLSLSGGQRRLARMW